MEKVNMQLPYINKNIKWEFGVVLWGDANLPNKNFILSEKFEYKGSVYTKIQPTYSITFKFNVKRENSLLESSLFVSSRFIYSLKRGIRDMVEGFQMKDLFFYNNGKMLVNKELSKKHEIRLPLGKEELRMMYTVVEDVSDGGSVVEYEGIAFIVNSYSNFVYITYDELCSMLDVLETTDFYNLALQGAIISDKTKIRS